MNIILATEVIHPGGAETFVLRLANALMRKGHCVQLFIFYSQGFRKELVTRLAPNVPLQLAHIPMPWILQKLDGALFRIGIDYSFRNRAIQRSLRYRIKHQNTDVIHSHLLKSDIVCLDAASSSVPVVTTIHGDYLQFFDKTKRGVEIPLLHYLYKAKVNLGALSKIVCISDKQLQFFKTNFETETAGKLEKIYNGYESTASVGGDKRKSLSIPTNAFVFGMVSRGIAEKGWERAIKALMSVDVDGAYLILVGAGAHLDALKTQYGGQKGLHFVGHSDEPLEWIQVFDVGLLPTTYPSESLPTVVIEYLFCGKPVIASDAGEIRNMVIQNEAIAGIILPLEEDIMTASLGEAMKSYLTDKTIFQQHQSNTKHCFEAFRMDTCLHRYEQVYQEAQLRKGNL